MIVRDFYIEAMELRYFVGINQINFDFIQFLKANSIDDEEKALNYIFKIIEELQDKNEKSTIQFISDRHVLNQDHIFNACYYMQKAFFHKAHISNKKNIELLLYLSTSRQISKGIESFGIDHNDLMEGNIIICIVSPIDNLDKINKDILQILGANEIELTINSLTIEKINTIIDNYEISNSQIKSVLKSYGNKENNIADFKNNLESLSLAIFDLICEKMALLNLEKTKMD
jgi:tRNA threonylcarbamoyladenosine modification (KEOPS) complex Cgi121 subunit